MRLGLTKKDAGLLLIAAMLVVGGGVVARLLLGENAFIAVSAASATIIVAVLLTMHHRLSEEHWSQENRRTQDYRQTESLLSIFFTLKPNLPLPSTRDWAASPDLLKKIMEVILSERPSLVVEASSGVSTLVIAYCLQRVGKGKVISLEHDATFAASNQRLISFHGLENIANIVHSPLKEVECNGQKWLWYDEGYLKVDQPIDLLIIDGPPVDIQKLARYPALPVLFGKLNSNCTIVLDDGRREDERRVVTRWGKEFPDLSFEYLDLEKGAYIVRKHK